MVVWMHQLLTNLTPKNLCCSVGYNLQLVIFKQTDNLTECVNFLVPFPNPCQGWIGLRTPFTFKLLHSLLQNRKQ